MGFDNDLMILMGFYSDQMDSNGILMGFYIDQMGYQWDLPSGNLSQFAIDAIAIEIVSFPIKHGDFP